MYGVRRSGEASGRGAGSRVGGRWHATGMDVLLSLLLVSIGLLVGGALGYLLARARWVTAPGDELTEARERAAAATAEAARLREENVDLRERAAQDHDVLRMLGPVQATLTQMRDHLSQLERERLTQFTELTEHLHAARRSDAELQRTTATLAGALHGTSQRGRWGEVQLRRIVETAGMMRHVDFDEQVSLAGGAGRNSARPDVVVHLPDDKHLVIDAKVPLDAYLAAQAIGTDSGSEAAGRRAELLAAHTKAVRAHVDALAKRRYDELLPGSPQLVIMFVPSESLLATAFENDPGLLDHALRAGVAPAAPVSLMALLRVTATLWTSSSVAEDARQLLDVGRTLYSRLGTVAGHLGQLGRSIEASVRHYNSAVASVESRLLVTARTLDAFDTDGLTVETLSGDRAGVRRFTSPELQDEQPSAAQISGRAGS